MLQAALYSPLQINPALCLWHHRLRHHRLRYHRRQAGAIPAANRNRSQHAPRPLRRNARRSRRAVPPYHGTFDWSASQV